MVDEELKKKVIEDVVLLKLVGFKPIIVHGGGKEISKWVDKVGMETHFVNGLRVTDVPTIIKVTARRDNPVRYKKEMKAFFKEHAAEYDVIWVNLCSLANIDYLKMAKKYGIPVRIIHSHNSRNMDSRLRGILHKINKKKIGRIATDYWACSYEAAKWFYPDKIINSDQYRLIYNAIDTSSYRFNEDIRDN